MATLGGGREGGTCMKLFNCIFLKCRSILLTLLSMIVSNKWQFSQLKCNQLPRSLWFTMYIRFICIFSMVHICIFG
jgi:hypothetical protein